MKLPVGVREKHGRLFGRFHLKGGESSFPLGSAGEAGAAVQRFYAIRALLRSGSTPEAIKDALRGDLGLATFVPQAAGREPVSVRQAARRWLEEHVRPDLTNAADIEARVNRVLLPFLGTKAITAVTRADCHAFKGHIRARCGRIAAGTMTHYLRTLRELLAWAENVELISESPWPRRGIMPRIVKGPPKRLTDEEVAVLTQLEDPWGFNLRLAIGTGCRWGELVRLQRTDLQPDGTLLIRKAKDGEPRNVPVTPALLQEIMGRQGPLFTTRGGTPFSESSNGAFNATIRRMAHRIVVGLPLERRRALGGLGGFHVHKTRHTYACAYIEAGGELAMLQEILGHASVTTTQVYGRPNSKAIRADAARVYAVQESNSRS